MAGAHLIGHPPRRRLLWLSLAFLCLVSCKHEQQAPSRPPPPVTVAVAATRQAPIYRDEIGHTTASEVVNIQSQVAGQIMERHFQDGDDLHKGQVLFIIDQRPYQAKVAEAQANLQLARSQIELAQTDYDRTLNAYNKGAASVEDRDTKQGALDNAKAQLQVNQAALDTANLNLSYCTISSPIDGRAGQRQVDVGNIVKANDTTLLLIQRLAPMYADFTITEADLPQVRSLMNAHTLKAQVTIPSRPDDVRDGELTFLDTMVQPQAGRVRLRATIPNQDHYFWPGQFVNVRLVLQVIPDAVEIPYACVQIGQQGPYVYLISPTGNAVQTPVQLGQREGDAVVVESGVKPADQVVLTGQLAVTPGGPVHVLPPATQTAPASSTSAATATQGAP